MAFHRRTRPCLQPLQQHAPGFEQDGRYPRPGSISGPVSAAVELRCFHLSLEVDERDPVWKSQR